MNAQVFIESFSYWTGVIVAFLGAYVLSAFVAYGYTIIRDYYLSEKLRKQIVTEVDVNQSIIGLWRIDLKYKANVIFREKRKVYPIKLITAVSDHMIKEGKLFDTLNKHFVVGLLGNYRKIQEVAESLVNDLNSSNYPKNSNEFEKFLDERLDELNQLDINLSNLEKDIGITVNKRI